MAVHASPSLIPPRTTSFVWIGMPYLSSTSVYTLSKPVGDIHIHDKIVTLPAMMCFRRDLERGLGQQRSLSSSVCQTTARMLASEYVTIQIYLQQLFFLSRGILCRL